MKTFIRTLSAGFLFMMFSISCSSTPLPSNNAVVIPEDFFGMVHVSRAMTPDGISLLDELGVRWVKTTFQWRHIESEKGVLDFSSHDTFIDSVIAMERKIVVVLGLEVDWLFPDGRVRRHISPENLPYFLNYVEQTVRHFKCRVDVWQIWNEPNFFRFWRGPNRDFFELARLAAETIREVDPDAYIIAPGFWRAPRRYIRNMYRAGAFENLDGVSFHPYGINPRGSMRLHDRFLRTLSDINFTGSVWITEVGHPTAGWYPTTVSLERFPAYVVKTLAGSAARGIDALLWYQLFDRYNRGEVPREARRDSEAFFGLVYPNFERKDAAWAFELCARFLPGSRFVPQYPIRENIPSHIVTFCFLEGITGDNTLIIWNDRRRLQRINLSLAAPAYIHDITNGQASPLPPEITLEVGRQPIMITWQDTEIMPRLSRP